MNGPLQQLRYWRACVRLFRQNVFAPEGMLIARAIGKLDRLRRLRLGWIGLVLASVFLHALLLSLVFHGADTTPPDAGIERVLALTLHAPRPAARSRPRHPAPPQPEPPAAQTAPQAAVRPQPAPAPPAVIGAGSSAAGGAGAGTGTGNGAVAGDPLEQFGGSPETERAVAAGLAWLARHQDANGRWNCDGFRANCPAQQRCDGHGHPQYDVGVTAMSLAAFLAHDERNGGKWRTVIDRAADWLVACQDPGGAFGREDASFMYNQALAVYALARKHARTPTPELETALVRALVFLDGARQDGGGWDYTSRATGRNDLSITGWLLLAFDACRDAGLAIPDLGPSRRMVLRMISGDGARVTYADSGIGRGEARAGLVPVALLSLLLAGKPTDSPLTVRLADATARHAPDAAGRQRWDVTGQSLYYWYYGTLALFHMGKPWWGSWNPAMKDTVLSLQRMDGHAHGSWDPDRNWIGAVGGRVYATAAAVLTLEVYYRVRPMYLERAQTAALRAR